MKKIQTLIVALSLTLFCSVPLSGQHFVPVYQSLYQPMNIIVDEAQIGSVDLEAGDEIGIFDTTDTGQEICVGSAVLSGPILPGTPFDIIASTDDALTPDQDGFIPGNTIFYRFWDNSESMELICVSMTYDPGFDIVFTSLGTALGSLEGIISPTADAGTDDETCEDTPYTLSGNATDQASVEWTTSGDGTFNNASLLDATYTPGADDISSGVATLTLTAFAVSPCGDHASDDMTLSILALPVAEAGEDAETCQDMAHVLLGIATNQSSVEWTTAGDGTFDDATLLNATYTPGSGDISNGSATLTLSAFATLPCSTEATDEMTLVIHAFPTADAGEDAGICQDDTYTLSGAATDYDAVHWATSGDGTFDDATSLDATYSPGSGDISNGLATLTLTAVAMAPCSTDAEDSMLLSIQSLPTTFAGPDASICENESYTLLGIAANQLSIEWSTSGDGIFDDATLLNATYTPGAGDISNGAVNLSITAWAIAPCVPFVNDVMTLSVVPLPETPNTPDGPIEVDIHNTPTSQYETQSAQGATAYAWALSPISAGSIIGGGLDATVTWNAAYHGLAYVKVFALNNCGGVISDSLEINVYNSVGLSETGINQIKAIVSPNPNRGFFQLSITASETELEMTLYSSEGNLIKQNTLQVSGNLELNYDLSDLPKGMYFLRLYNEKINLLNKVIIQ